MTVETAPLTPARWEDLVTVFGGGAGKGDCGRCWCMWWRLPRAGIDPFAGVDVKALFRARVDAGPPPGILAYENGAPVGWVQVGPRVDVPEWNKPGRLTAPPDPAEAADPALWGISCFVVKAGRRKRGYGTALLDAAVDWARAGGAAWIDACPVETSGTKGASALYHGVASTFLRAGFVEVARRHPTRPVVRLTL